MRMIYYYSVSDTGKLRKRNSKFFYQESYLHVRPSDNITSSDALPLSYRRLVGAEAIKLPVDS